MNRHDRRAILETLPQTADLLVIGLEAGATFDQCMSYIVSHYPTLLSSEFRRAYVDIAQGRPREEAFGDLAQRCQTPALTRLIVAVNTSEQTGASLSPLIRLQAEDIRRNERQRIEEKIRKTPIKMTLVMGGCIFPSILCALLAPAAAKIWPLLSHL